MALFFFFTYKLLLINSDKLVLLLGHEIIIKITTVNTK